MKNFAGAATLACALGLAVSGAAARAEQSISILGNSPAAQCSDAATFATISGQASLAEIAYCNDAISQQVLTRHELAASYLNRSVLQLALGNFDAVIADDNTALGIEANLPEAYLNRGAALSNQGHYREADNDFTSAITFGVQHIEKAYFNRGLTRENVGDVKGAYLDYTKASELSPDWVRPKSELTRFTVVHQADS